MSCARLLTCHSRIVDKRMVITAHNSWQMKTILKQRNGVVVPDDMSVYDVSDRLDGSLRKRAQKQWREEAYKDVRTRSIPSVL